MRFLPDEGAKPNPKEPVPNRSASRRITEAHQRLVQLDDASGKLAPATEWKRKLAAFQQAAQAAEKKGVPPWAQSTPPCGCRLD